MSRTVRPHGPVSSAGSVAELSSLLSCLSDLLDSSVLQDLLAGLQLQVVRLPAL